MRICAAAVVLLAVPLGTTAQLRLPADRVVIAQEVGVNSAGADYSPTFYREGVAFVSTREGDLRRRLRSSRARKRDIMEVYYAPVDEAGALAEAEPLFPKLKADRNSGPVSFSRDGATVFLTRNAAAKRSRRGGRVAARLQLYELRRGIGDAWSAPSPVDFADATSNDAHPALAPDGSYMVFVSDRDGGFGGLDLWIVERVGDTWSIPRNLGAAVNTGGNEGFPYLHPDGTLYYATTVAGEGGASDHLDIVYTRYADGAWATPVPLGPPFNTPADDFGLVVDAANARGYFSSSRAGGFGEDDLYRFEIVGGAGSTAEVLLAVAVSDASTAGPLQGAAVTYLNADTTSLATALDEGIVSTAGDPIRVIGGTRYMTDIEGRGVIRLQPGRYLVEVSREGYESIQTTVEVGVDGTSLPAVLTPKVPCAETRVSVVEQGSVRPVTGATIAVTPAASADLMEEVRSDAGGVGDVCLPCGGLYEVTATSGRLVSTPAVVDTRGPDCRTDRRTTITLYLAAPRPTAGPAAAVSEERGTPLAPGTQFQMPSVFYTSSSWSLSPAAREELDDLARLMRRFPEMRVALGSHTDATGPAAFNRQLSQRRADEARRYLMQTGEIAPERVVAVGYGESQLRNGCRDGVACSRAAHAENRRTEVTILGEGVSVTYPPPIVQAPRVTPPPAERTSSAVYLVIASSHADEAAARRAAAEVRELGYDGVRVEEIEGVTGRAVVAARFGTLAEATQFTRALQEAHGINAYVRRVSDRR